MDRLPHDIYEEICTYLDRTSYNRPALATVSRQWQSAIERLTFKELRIDSTEIDTFKRFLEGHRCRFLNRLKFLVVLPSYGDELRCRFENADDRSKNNQAFTLAFTRLFDVLQTWNPQAVGSIELELEDVYSVSDHPFVRMSDPSRDFQKALFGLHRDKDQKVVDLWSFRFCYSYIRFTEEYTLPTLLSVRSFSIATPTTRQLADKTMADIVGSLPNLEDAGILFNDGCIQYIGLRRALRAEFAVALEEKLSRCRQLKTLRVLTHVPSLWISDSAKGSLNDAKDQAVEYQRPDALSTAIRVATSGMPRLEALRVRGVIGGSLFMSPCHKLAAPMWSNMKNLHVTFRNRRPEGGHYFRHPTIEKLPMPTEDENPPGHHSVVGTEDPTLSPAQFDPASYHGSHGDFGGVTGVIPDPDALEALFTPFVRICQSLPMLEYASLYTSVPVSSTARNKSPDGKVMWGMWYLSPGIEDINVIDEVGEDAFKQTLHYHRLYRRTDCWTPSGAFERLVALMEGDRCREIMVLPIP